MQYYKLLQLEREPFSNSPDPDFFFNSYQHRICLQKIELALRLKRGLNVVIGDVGTGKTTLCRQLIRKLSIESHFETHLVLDPSFNTPLEFLKSIAGFICYRAPENDLAELELKELIKRHLFLKGVDHKKTIVLIIDEGQKMSQPCLEILRELLNYETNSYKLLQIIIFAQLEFRTNLEKQANFADRINLLHHLEPLNFSDTRNLIYHRLKLSSTTAKPKNLFTLPALWTIYRASRGYPRKIINLCHQSVLALIIQNRTKAGWSLIRSCRMRLNRSTRTERSIIVAIVVVVLSAAALNLSAWLFMKPEQEFELPKPYKISPTTQRIESLPSVPVSDKAALASEPDPVVVEQPAGIAEVAQTNEPVIASMEKDVDPRVEIMQTSNDEAESTPLVPAPQPPEILGHLIVKPGDTLGAMAKRVYGIFNKYILAAVIDANKHIQNPNNIDIGNIVLFPAMDFEMRSSQEQIFLIRFDEQPSLPAAMQHVDLLFKEMQLPVRMFASWSPVHRLRFQLVLNGYFDSNEAADRYLELLPSRIADQATIISKWSDKTSLFSDPYGGGLRLSPLMKRTQIEEQKKTW